MDKINTAKSVEESFRAEMDRASSTTPATPTVPTGTQPKDATVPASPQDGSIAKKYKLPDGREVEADQVLAEYNNLHKDYTVKTQKLTELEKQPAKPSEQTPPNANLAPSKGENTGVELSDVDRRMQAELDRLGYVRQEGVEKIFEQKTPGIIQESSKTTQAQLNVNQSFDKIEAEWNGENGKFKAERAKVIEFINDRKAYYLTPQEATDLVYQDQIIAWRAKELAAGVQPSLPVTEKSGAAVTDPPKVAANVSYSFQNGKAEAAVREILQPKSV